jgi:subfamily B ATP-binding cassette protein MsbA
MAFVAVSETEVDNNSVFSKLVLDYIAENRWFFVKFCAVVLLTLPLEYVGLPQFYSRLLENIRTGDSAATKRLLLFIAGLWVVILVFTSIKLKFDTHLSPDYLSFVRRKLIGSVIERHRNDYKDIEVGKYITQILDISRNLREFMVWIFSEAFPIAMVLVFMVTCFTVVSLKYGAILLVGTGLAYLAAYRRGMPCVMLSSNREIHWLTLSEKLNDTFNNLMNLYLTNTDAEEVKLNQELEKQHIRLLKKHQKIARSTVVVLGFISLLTTAVLAYCMYGDLKTDRLTKPVFVSLWIVLLYYLNVQLRICHETPNLLMKCGMLHNATGFIRDLLTVKTTSRKRDVIHMGTVSFRNVSFKYPGTSHYIMKNFDLEVKADEKVAIVGTSGSGKTTAMKLLVGMYQLDEPGSSIYIDDTNINDIDATYLRKQVNYVNQRTQLFNKSILQNVQYGNPHITEAHVLSTLDEYGLDSVFHKLKHGIHTNAGVNGGHLSLGMQKVTMLLRGLYKPAKIVILDEPLAGLDSKTRTKIMKCIMHLCKNKTLIVITHDHEIIPLMDRVVNINKPTAKAG